MIPQRISLPRVRAPSETENLPKAAEVGGSLESSLLQLIHDHHHSSLRLGVQTEKAKRDAIMNGKRVADLLMDIVNGGVEESFINEKRIELEIRSLISTVLRYSKQTDQWRAATHSINSALKEIGDFENWMKTMDYDCKSINAAIQNIYQS
ncbi:biogenesis of lysosome-related organelles complex 1 subunit 1 isoform X2 [Macadamia integrifolia]|uniref:biogenesis of lysosome-related organelles complex 1 subunit 1 isoform X2 n=1 Tax=Macadamia integrifolia TaxID=60698 RepID=UPI001C4FB33E|nr:biogenesis of lysosome-related organelles complex 1 subunit 1 isoform X2 [Macadamia integrifolia]XP_042490237.1 biogenesis of lysosome-related organelles complex 1 subunit 1 isoform X2 [Macadamia integrifolia]XP_042490238.1 biogenesis of lysosome-related organelles complex 1 subunit 1 isoform X2 [Macadamia integrifolia]XP_042490239.1 biogenesis of lysosome-related organelles complex 1 subunit 1 isoform X2 [Macadamia integrifolia]XP_042490240.1 biogenesis of lysosome-related organelles comple